MKSSSTNAFRKSGKPKHPKAPMSFRKNVLPPLLGLGMFAAVMGLFNAQWLAAQAYYHFIKPVSSSVQTAELGQRPAKDSVNLYIPKIDVTAPVIYDETSLEEQKVQLALRRGVVHYGSTALPGQAGNIVILGHSSGQLWAPGDYKFVFTLLDRLELDERILLDYQGTRYIFRVSEIKVVSPNDLSVLQPTNQPQLTLITCTPVGTNKNRLVIHARQVSPKPETSTPIAPQDVKRITTSPVLQ